MFKSPLVLHLFLFLFLDMRLCRVHRIFIATDIGCYIKGRCIAIALCSSLAVHFITGTSRVLLIWQQGVIEQLFVICICFFFTTAMKKASCLEKACFLESAKNIFVKMWVDDSTVY